MATVHRMVIVLVRINTTKDIHVLYPYYYMPDNPQNTMGLPALTYYEEMKSVRLEALAWIRFATKGGTTLMQTTIPHYYKSQLMDYIPITIVQPNDDYNPLPRIQTPHIKQVKRMTHDNILKKITSETSKETPSSGTDNEDKISKIPSPPSESPLILPKQEQSGKAPPVISEPPLTTKTKISFTSEILKMNEDIISLFHLHRSCTTNISEQITPTLFTPVANSSFTNNK